MTSYAATSTDGTRIAFQVAGSGSPLILLHGLPGSAARWDEAGYVAKLARDFRVISIDSRGHGASGKPREPVAYHFDCIAADILAVADACDVVRFQCIGSSWGANAALRLAAINKRVTHVVSLGGIFGKPMSEERAVSVKVWWQTFIDAKRDERLDEIGLSATEREELRLIDPHAVLAATRGLQSWPAVEPEQLSIPTLLIVGGEDKRVLESLELHRASMMKAGIVARILDGLDHRQTFDRSDVTLPFIRSFLKPQPGAS